ncbi:MAG TPA: hypothetical protein VNV44_11015 [Solirubrobacteraceae bacterium]|jgi:hypothetical protein|nr:hypothetical protein [Solirubrobacteraceae bacterium]
MSEQDRDLGPQPSGGGRRRGWTAARLCVLIAILAGLVVFLVLPNGSSAPRRTAARCASTTSVPEVRRVPAKELGALREAVSRVLPERAGRLYEEGAVTARIAWTDERPSPPTVSPAASRPAGYEMRWNAPNGVDILGDVLVFSTPARAQRFLTLASSTFCHGTATQVAAPRPPAGRNLAWVNPDGLLQADLFIARGTHVYRVTEASGGGPTARSAQEAVRPDAGLARVFATINVLACLLPAADCTRVPSATTA